MKDMHVTRYMPDFERCHNEMLMRMRTDINDAFAKLDRDFKAYRERVKMLSMHGNINSAIKEES